MKNLTLCLLQGSYDILIEQGCLTRIGSLLPQGRRMLIVTDDGVPAAYAETVKNAVKGSIVFAVPQGEGSKCFAMLESLCRTMLQNGFDRNDCVVAVGGGVVGDLAGFAAATFMRGIDFYNIPTTLLSQVDSSIGGKVAVNLDGLKNIVGAFYQPKAVFIDPDTLQTLPPRRIADGMAEAIKMALTCDGELFAMIEQNDFDMETLIYRSLLIKKTVVEQDEKETGLRRILNFGHTVGHAIESKQATRPEAERLTHGECVALGMIPMCAPAVQNRLLPVLERFGLPTTYSANESDLLSALSHDKKADGEQVHAVFVDRIGSCRQCKETFTSLAKKAQETFS